MIQQPHIAWVGDEDPLAKMGAETARERSTSTLLEIVSLPGNHFTSLNAALDAFHQRAVRDAAK